MRILAALALGFGVIVGVGLLDEARARQLRGGLKLSSSRGVLRH